MRRVAAVALLLAAAITGMTLTGAAVVQAQDSPRLPDHRFFGFAEDVTIDGEPLAAGVEIVAMIDGVAVSNATVSTAGSWYIDVSQAKLTERPCNVSLIFDGVSSEQQWDRCPTRVSLDLVSPAEPDSLQSEDAAPIAEPADEESMMQADDSDDSDSAPADTPQADTSGDDIDAAVPGVPGTGSGGLLRDESSRPSAAAITGILMFAVVAVALLIGRRTDGAR